MSFQHCDSRIFLDRSQRSLVLDLALKPPSVEASNSREKVGKVGCWEIDLATREVTIGSSLGVSVSLWRFLIRRLYVRPPLAFFY
nr:hypothetical protein CFP56_19854 [Quercus suber]